MEIGQVKFGQEGMGGNFGAKIEKGKLALELDAVISPAGVTSKVIVAVDATIVMDAIAKAIPGTVDDAVIAVMKAALQAV